MIYFDNLGPNLPNLSDGEYPPYYGHSIVSNDETVYYANSVTLEMFRLECNGDLDSCQWKRLLQKIEIIRPSPFTTLIPDFLSNCTSIE